MKKTALIFVFILAFLNTIDAQEHKWHNRKCGVTNINNCTKEEFECLWRNASANVIGGALATAVGTGFIVYGYIRENYYFQPGDFGSGISIMGGVLINLVGLPVWIVGVARESNLRKTPNYDTFKLASFKVSPSIGVNQFNNTPNYGVTLSLTF